LILEPRGAETGADNDYESPSAMRRVRHEPGFIPQVFQPSPFNEALLAYATFIRGQMEDISGVHEVSNGSVPAGVTAGNAIELLQQSDQTQMSEFVTCIETAQKKRAEWEIALVSQFYSEPRLVAVSQLSMPLAQPGTHPGSFLATPPDAGGGGGFGGPGGPAGSAGPMGMAPPPQPGAFGGPDGPSTAALAVRVFEGLTKGGQVRIDVVPGSATLKTPAAQSQQIMDMAAKGFFTPQMLPVLKMVADELGLTRSDTFTDRIDEAYAQIMSNTPPPEVAAQQQMMMGQASAAQQSTMDQQHMASMEALKTHAAIELDTAQTDNKIRLAQATAVAQAHAKAALNRQEHGQAVERQTGDQHHEVAMLSAQRALMATSPQPPPPEGEEDSHPGSLGLATLPETGGGGE